jgi:mycothiol synthase
MIRAIESDADLEAYARVKCAVVPEDPVTAEQVRRSQKPDWVLLLAEVDGAVVGSGIAGRSHLTERWFLEPRVLPEARGRGIGAALLRSLAGSGRAVGLELGTCSVNGRDERSVAFAHRFGFEEVDRELQQVRDLGEEPAPAVPTGIELVTIAERPELLEAAYPLAAQGYTDMPTPAPVEVPLDDWLREEATLPEGSFVALEAGEVVGYAGLVVHAEHGKAEHGLTVVRRDRRRAGLAQVLKRAQAHWAATHGYAQLVTWTQKGNEGMQALNDLLGYRREAIAVRMWGPLP